MRILAWIFLGLVALAGAGIGAVAVFAPGQSGDSAYRPQVARPAFLANKGPALCLDHGHHNMHRANGTYRPFRKLMEADGYRVALHKGRFTAESLKHCDLVVIANAMGAAKPKLFGINLPVPSKGQREDPAFEPAEIAALKAWVRGGGAMLLIADHFPVGTANLGLARALGVEMSGGYTSAPNRDPGARDPGQLVYSRDNGLLGSHPILEGRSPEERVTRIVTFTGQSLAARAATPLLRLPKGATDDIRSGDGFRTVSAEGRSQGLALRLGAGRVVLLGEAACLTAQREKAARWGFAANNGNEQFALNIVRWLSRKL
jgi:hypothetical protein